MRELDKQYLLRVWKDGKGDEALRISLRELCSQETLYFSDTRKVLEHLQTIGKRNNS